MAWFTRHLGPRLSHRQGRFAKRPATLMMLVALAVILPLLPARPAAAASVPVTVTITRFVELVDEDPKDDQHCGDYYAAVIIDGQGEQESEVIDGNTTTCDDRPAGTPYTIDFSDPSFTFTRYVDSAKGSVTVTIEMLDNDLSANPDDRMDINPLIGPGDAETMLNLTVDLATSNWSGDVPLNQQFSTGVSDPADPDNGIGTVFFTISTFSTNGDADGDGLFDMWETRGVDTDGINEPNPIDVDLLKLGANPNHKDIFVELDIMRGQVPTRAALQAIKDAFKAAPCTAGSQASALPKTGDFPKGVDAPPNPDDTCGIRFHIDTGALLIGPEDGVLPSCRDGLDNGTDGLTDTLDLDCTSTGVEDGATADSCNDGIDNNGDGLTDGEDKDDCAIFENLGGGGSIAAMPTCGLNSQFYAIKAANFDPNRRLIFHYAISGVPLAGPCDSDDDGLVDDFDKDGVPDPVFGGLGELGGNDFIEYNHDGFGASIMHELGHNLNLPHGGDENTNCKPNYLSIMNYSYGFGIPQAGSPPKGGGVIIDYSPPRTKADGSTRGAAPLSSLKEDALDETTILDPNDSVSQLVFVDGAGNAAQKPINQPVNWDGDSNPNETDVDVDLDTLGCASTDPVTKPTFTTLTGHDDWSRISLPFRQFGDALDGPINPEDNDYPTLEEFQAQEQAINTTDLALAISDSPDPVAAGTQLTYSFTVTNNGPNRAVQMQIVDTLPAGAAFAGGSPGCAAAAGTVTCDLGELLAGATGTATIIVDVAADLVFKNGGPTTLTNSASVSHLAGPDKDPSNNTALAQTQVVAVADLAVRAFGALNPPARILIGKSLPLTLQATVGNDGPSSPMDASLAMSATAAAGASVTPATATATVPALAVGTPQTATQTFTIACAAPGFHTYTFTTAITPANAADNDPNAANNQASITLTLDCVVPVAINIKPGGNPNPINLGSEIVPVAVLTTRAGEYGLPLAFAATRIDPLSVRFGPVSVGADGAQEAHLTGHLEDSRELGVKENVKDGDLDMVLHFAVADSGLQLSDTQACVLGEFVAADGNRYRFFGCDGIVPIQ